ncbi:MAG: PTS system mannose/fructose/sorbose family transporter subunit IID [Endomicrobium sp.]|nr:PTS system mannose/fructose/sorbose family transporter subunit IID [Endomicrobium sp.]
MNNNMGFKMIKIYFSMFIKTFFIQALWNYERLQNVGFLFILKPFLCKVYSDDDKRKEAFLRHMGFFNTHPYMASLIIAIVANMEKELSKCKRGGKKSDVNSVKNIMEGPLAAIGDSFFGGTLRYLVAFVSIFILFLFVNLFGNKFIAYNFWIPLVFIFFYNVVHIPVRFLLMFMGFKFNMEKNIFLLSSFKFMFLGKILYCSEVIVVIGALILYFKFLFFGSLNTRLFGNDVCDILIYSVLFVLSIFVSWKFSAVFLFYSTIFVCVGISCLGI